MQSHPLALLPLIFALAAAEAPARQWVLVTAPAHRAALEPLCEHRKAQGFRVTVVETTDLLTPEEVRAGEAGKLRDHVCRLCREFRGTSCVLLVGAVGGGPGEDVRGIVPALRGTVGRMKGEPTDSGYGSPSAGGLPAVAVGRFPARTAEEA